MSEESHQRHKVRQWLKMQAILRCDLFEQCTHLYQPPPL
nr:MAG TPA: hypothetical protein [Crassvirales sp.]